MFDSALSKINNDMELLGLFGCLKEDVTKVEFTDQDLQELVQNEIVKKTDHIVNINLLNLNLTQSTTKLYDFLNCLKLNKVQVVSELSNSLEIINCNGGVWDDLGCFNVKNILSPNP
jgi:hypothetical protein